MDSAFQLEVLLTEETRQELLRYFRRVRLPVVEEATCGWERHHREHLRYVDDVVLDWLEKRLGRRIELERGKDGRLELPPELARY